MTVPMPDPLIDPDCHDRKHGACLGGMCECTCHRLPAGLCACGIVQLLEGNPGVPAEGRAHTREGCTPLDDWCGCGLHWMSSGQPPISEDGKTHTRAACTPHPPP